MTLVVIALPDLFEYGVEISALLSCIPVEINLVNGHVGVRLECTEVIGDPFAQVDSVM